MKRTLFILIAMIATVSAGDIRPMRGVYFATHFGNWYENAGEKELTDYIGELAYWGCTSISCWLDLHHFRGIDDPKAKKSVALLKRIYRAAKAKGLRTDLTMVANEAYDSSPKELRADWSGGHDGYKAAGLQSHYHREICPSNPDGLAYLLKIRQEIFNTFRDIKPDSITITPYDQGGCTCSKCAPYGSNAYPKLAKQIAKLYRETVNPSGEVYLSTWNFGEHPDEWQGLLAQKDELRKWVTMLEVAPQHLPDIEKNPVLPFFCMSEISMNEMLPWGGCGANPLPMRFQKELTDFPHLSGLRPYSEGIYEDLSKIMELAVLSGKASNTLHAAALYAERYFGKAAAAKLPRIAELMEQNIGHWTDIYQDGRKANPYDFRIIDRGKPWRLGLKGVNLEKSRVAEVEKLLNECEAMMSEPQKKSWRWRVLKIRGEIDADLLAGKSLAEMEQKFLELAKIYKVTPETTVLLTPPSEKLLRAAKSFLFVPEP